jgi:hypothetical protein
MPASDSGNLKSERARMAAPAPAMGDPSPSGVSASLPKKATDEPPIQLSARTFYARLLPVAAVAIIGLVVLTFDKWFDLWSVLLVLVQAVFFGLSIFLWFPGSIQTRSTH